MSYSFNARAATKALVMEQVSSELDKVVAGQPIHAADRAQAQAAVEAFVGVLKEESGKELAVTVSGSLGWREDQVVTSASVNVSASLVT